MKMLGASRRRDEKDQSALSQNPHSLAPAQPEELDVFEGLTGDDHVGVSTRQGQVVR
jgi:hypothetical protein